MKFLNGILASVLATIVIAHPAKSEPNLTATLEICTRYSNLDIIKRAEEIVAQGWLFSTSDRSETGLFSEYKFTGAGLASPLWELNLRRLNFRNIGKTIMHECNIEIPSVIDPVTVFSGLTGETVNLEATEAEFYQYSAEAIAESKRTPQTFYVSTFKPASHEEAFITIRRLRETIDAPWTIEIHAWVPEVELSE